MAQSLNPALPRIQPGVGRGVRVPSSPNPFSVGLLQAGRDVSAIGAELEQQAKEAKAKADRIHVNEALNEAEGAIFELEVGKDGYTKKRGKEVLSTDGTALNDSYSQRLDEQLQGIRGRLTADQQVEFDIRVGGRARQFRRGVIAHERTEIDRYEEQVDAATILTSREVATRKWNDPQVREEQKNRTMESINSIAERRKWSKEQKDAATLQEMSKFHRGIVEQAVDARQFLFAKDYLFQNKSEFLEADRDRVDKMIEQQETQAFATSQGLRIVRETQARKGSLFDALEAGSRAAAGDALKSKEIQTEIASFWRAAEAEKRQRENEAVDEAFEMASRGQAVPASLRNQIGAHNAALDAYIRSRREAASGATRKQSDPDVTTEIWGLTNEELAGKSPAWIRSKYQSLTPGDYEQLNIRWNRVRNPKQAKGTDPEDIDTAGAQRFIKQNLSAIGALKGKAPSNNQKISNMQNDLLPKIAEEQQRLKRKMTDVELQKFISEQFLYTKEPGMLYGFNIDNIATQTVDDIPNDTRAAVVEIFRARTGGREPSRGELLQEYRGLLQSFARSAGGGAGQEAAEAISLIDFTAALRRTLDARNAGGAINGPEY